MNNLENIQPENDVMEVAISETSFGDILEAFEETHSAVQAGATVKGKVVALQETRALVDIGQKSEGVLDLSTLTREAPKIGDEITVTVSGRTDDGALALSIGEVAAPKDWSAIEAAFAEGRTITGTVTGQVKGGLTVDIGSRAFMPASRSGTRDISDLHTLLGKEIQCRIIKFDAEKEDIVVDRRVVLEEELKKLRADLFDRVELGSIIEGTVRTVMEYGAFVDIGGLDGLLHVTEISYGKAAKPADVLKTGEKISVKVIKKDPKNNKISLSLKQTQADPWSEVAEKYPKDTRVKGVVVRLADFGAFVELEPGIEGLIHLSEMSWSKKVHKPSDVLKVGDVVEAVVLEVKPGQRRIALGLKQALGDPWAEVPGKYPVGSIVEGTVTNLAKFGAFVELEEGVEAMIHIGDLASEKRIEHPQEVLKSGETVRAQVLSVEPEKRRIRLGMRQLIPTPADEFVKEHKVGDTVTGRVVEIRGQKAKIELGERVHARCVLPGAKEKSEDSKGGHGQVSIQDLGAQLANRWKQGGSLADEKKQGGIRIGQVSRFVITALDPEKKAIDLEVAEV
ncbi:MAG: 30S ribosomal protein S1 [Bryobacterales bacterium]|nr:30S ribosomal protein S1 [Bryobacterales bacterium]